MGNSPASALADGAVPDLEESGKQQPDRRHRHPAERRLEPAARRRQPAHLSPQPEQGAHEPDRHQPRQHAEHGVDEEFRRMVELIGGHREERLVAEGQAEDQPARYRAEDDRPEHPGMQVPHDLLEREQDRGNRGVEGGRDRRCGPDGNQLSSLLRIQPEGLAHRGGDPGADLGRRSLTPQRNATAQGEHPAQVFSDRHPEGDSPVLRDQRRLRLRNAAAPCFVEPAVQHKAGDQGPEHRSGEADRSERLAVNHDVRQPFGHHDERHDDPAHQGSDPEVEPREEAGTVKEIAGRQSLHDPGDDARPDPAHALSPCRGARPALPSARPTSTVTAAPIRL